MAEFLKYEEKEYIGIVTIDRPPVNALCNDMVDEWINLLNKLESHRSLRCLIITGGGQKAFMAGADIKELDQRDYIEGRYETRRRQDVFTRLEQLHFPVIAAVNGFALGGGLELALACTIRIASTKAVFGAPEVNLGITPGDGATQRLPRLIGQGRAMMMILTGEKISAETSLQYGLITHLVATEELMDTALLLAKKIASKPPLAIQYAKEAVRLSADVNLQSGLTFESYLHALSCASHDKKEGVEAFVDKRSPQFIGQ